MNKLQIAFVKTPVLGSASIFLIRLGKAASYLSRFIRPLLIWLFRSKETTNFTYDLEETNKRYLASTITLVTGIGFEQAMGYISELEDDAALKQHIFDVTSQSQWAIQADTEARYGRRIGWYAFVRALRPTVVVETGVDKGLGACVLTAALKKNSEEGHEGRYYGTDINPEAGYLLGGTYAQFGEILYGDSIESLRQLKEGIDLFINDSDHSVEYEAGEYIAVKDKLSENAIILGDNSLVSDELLQFSLATNRQFVFFQERPLAHWYHGAGIGISFKSRR